MFVGYGSDGWNFGAGGYYDPRVKFNELYVYLELETNGTYYDHYTYEAMEKTIEAGAVLRDVTTKFSDNPFITETYNPETGLYSYKIKVPDRNRVSAIKAAPDAGIMDGVQKNGKYSFNSVNPVESAIIMTKRRYQGNYFNFKNFNTYQRRTTQGLRLRYFNLFGYTWFTL